VNSNTNATTGCNVDTTVSCYTGGTGYSCTGSNSPESAGHTCTTNNAGDWCCYVNTNCSQNTSLSCTTGSYGYSCTAGTPAPDVAYPSLICSVPTVVGGVDEYCCGYTTVASGSTCNVDSTVDGCVGDSYGFSCTGSDRPDADYSGITCSSGTLSGSDTLYCCVYNDSTTTQTVTCNQNYQAPANGGTCGVSCDACLQTYACGAKYKACDSTCQSAVGSMETCVSDAYNTNGGTVTADAESSCSTRYLGSTSSAAYVLWWEVIRSNLDCATPCCTDGLSH
jgi:hypothetical protein